MRETLVLKDGRKVIVRELSPHENVKALRKHINDLVGEDNFLMVNKKVSFAEEKKWLEERIGRMRSRKSIDLVADWNGRIVGTCFIGRDKGREEHNATAGIAIAKGFRGAGLGYFMLKKVIGLAKKRLKPAMIYLSHLGPNEVAHELYEALGFREVARLPAWTPFRGKRVEKVFMVLKK